MSKKTKTATTETKQTEKQTAAPVNPVDAFRADLLTGREKPANLSHLENAAANDPYLAARCAWVEQLNREALSDFPNVARTLGTLREAYGLDFRRYITAYMEKIGKAVEMDERTENNIRRMAEKLLSNTEYSTGYSANVQGLTAGQVPLNPEQMRERANAFSFLLTRALFGWRPVLHWGITDNNPRITWAKI